MLTRLVVLAVMMFGFGFAMVPFYQKMCQVTGLGGLLQADDAPANTQVDTSRLVTMEFDTNTHGLPWDFVPLQRSVRIHPGQLTEVEFQVRNNSDEAIVGQAIPSYGPQHAAQYVKKLECFCFRQQALAAGETRRMPVQLIIDPALPADVNTVTLSYTFFEVQGGNATSVGKGG